MAYDELVRFLFFWFLDLMGVTLGCHNYVWVVINLTEDIVNFWEFAKIVKLDWGYFFIIILQLRLRNYNEVSNNVYSQILWIWKFWIVSLEHFVERKPLISEEWTLQLVFSWRNFFGIWHLLHTIFLARRLCRIQKYSTGTKDHCSITLFELDLSGSKVHI